MQLLETATEEYDGTSWTNEEQNDVGTTSGINDAGGGTQTSALIIWWRNMHPSPFNVKLQTQKNMMDLIGLLVLQL